MQNRWLYWTPSVRITKEPSDTKPSKPTKPGSEGFEGPCRADFPITRNPRDHESQAARPEAPTNGTTMPPSSDKRMNMPTTADKSNCVPGTSISLPTGVRLIKYSSFQYDPRGVAGIRIIDLEKFIKTQLTDLDARLNHPVQIRGGGSVFEILAKLADVGLELAISRPEELPSGGLPSVVRESGEPASEADKPGGGAQ